MKRAVAAALVLLPGAAFGQSYQTVLPLSPAEKVALEARLSTVLDYAGSGEETDIVLPTGRVATVRTYQTVRPNGAAPCRGYRVDLQGRGSRTAVDGFRCRQSAGAWAIAQPETVILQETVAARRMDDLVIVEESGPLDLRGGLFNNEVTVVVPDGVSPDPLPGRLRDEPLYPGDETGLLAPEGAAPPPVPRPAPRGEVLSAAADPATIDDAEPADAAEPADVPRLAEAPAVEAEDDVVEDDVAEAGVAEDGGAEDDVAENAGGEGGTAVASAGDAARVIPSTAGVSRTVGAREETNAPPYATDERVTVALQDLDYLDPVATPAPEAVAAAVDEFARDERFALPISTDALIERLEAALDRSETVALCGSGDGPVCVAR